MTNKPYSTLNKLHKNDKQSSNETDVVFVLAKLSVGRPQDLPDLFRRPCWHMHSWNGKNWDFVKLLIQDLYIDFSMAVETGINLSSKLLLQYNLKETAK